jgi:hypothetical protein
MPTTLVVTPTVVRLSCRRGFRTRDFPDADRKPRKVDPPATTDAHRRVREYAIRYYPNPCSGFERFFPDHHAQPCGTKRKSRNLVNRAYIDMKIR